MRSGLYVQFCAVLRAKPRQRLFQLVSFLFFIVHNADSDHRAFLPPRKVLYKYDIPPNAAASTFYERIAQFFQDISGTQRAGVRKILDHRMTTTVQ